MKIKARVNPNGFMGSASREHKVKKGKGSFKRREKHQKKIVLHYWQPLKSVLY